MPGVAGHVGLVMVTPVVKDGDDRLPVVLDFPLLGAFTLANTALGSGFGQNPLGRLAIERSTGARADPGKTVGGTGASVVYQQIAPDVIQLVVATSSGS